ncbi:MAG: glycosyltransferase [Flexistipes sinusarabici]|uniref:Glycosyltransferase n=1 Tax=Flexistipes sinusarabici TaxID=2352 RepID=A0A5D0MHS0_FLESI|nr:glycosyltransferase [Flexistipes sinusarabici]TYB33254.1 MAG: glycosyltransferase [Flexistipes sinusarabici]
MTTFNEHVYAVTVTYGNRFHLLKQVIDAALAEGVAKVIVVDNNSAPESRDKLKAYEKELGNNKIKVLYLDDNYGSAGGFKRGLEAAYNDSECEYIWLLDDDNVPQKDSLKVLENFWKGIKRKDKNEKVSLLSYRKDRVAYKKAIMSNKSDFVLGRKNSFLGFHIIDLPKKVVKIIKRKIGVKTFLENQSISSGKVSVAPYGGMFFHRNLINTIGYPNEELYLYADDHEWSFRITQQGGNIILCLDSEIEDVDLSWHLQKKESVSLQNYLNNNQRFRIYFTIRNRVFFEQKNLITSKKIYLINKRIYLFMIFFFALFSNKLSQLSLIKKAVKEGEKGDFSKNKVEEMLNEYTGY